MLWAKFIAIDCNVPLPGEPCSHIDDSARPLLMARRRRFHGRLALEHVIDALHDHGRVADQTIGHDQNQ